MPPLAFFMLTSRQPFFADYAAKYDGRTSYLDPPSRVEWKYGMSQPKSLVSEAIRNQCIFADWVATKMFPSSNTSCSSRMQIAASAAPEASPRDKYYGRPTTPTGWAESRVAEHAEYPDYVFPIGQLPYHSDITGTKKCYPLACASWWPTAATECYLI